MSEPTRGPADLVPRLEGQGYSAEAVAERRRWVEERTGARLVHAGSATIPPEEMRGNVENPVGAVQVPLGVAGPLLVQGEHAQGLFYIPLATTEGALVRSYERGMVAITRAGGAAARVLIDENRVSPVFLFEDVAAAAAFARALPGLLEALQAEAETTTRHGRLLRVEPLPVGREVIVHFAWWTADAHGMNMIVKGTDRACRWLVEHGHAPRHYVFSGAESEKRASGALLAGGKGKKVTAGVRLPPRLVRAYLHTTPEGLADVWHRTVLGHLQAGSAGYNGHIANGLTALFIACGQDVANIANSAVGITSFEVLEGGDLYASVTLPSLTVATVGGGTGLGTARECLEMLGCAGAGKALKLAEIAAALVLGGELSFGAAIASGEFVTAHETYGRNRPRGIGSVNRKRPFRGLRTAPDPRYDVVVIGAGVGGLIAANLLAQDGLRVLLAEQHYMVGGYCSTFRRAGYTFDSATHFYPLLGNPETLTGRLLRGLGIDAGWIKMDPVDTFHFPDGTRFEVPADLDVYLARLRQEFPAESGALDSFFQAVRETYTLGLLHYFRGRPLETLGRLAPWHELTVRQALDRWFTDPKLKLLLAADCPHWGSPPGRTSFVFDSMLRLSYFLGNYYPKGGSQAFADAMAARFEELGGHVLTSTLASRILIEEGEARGVDLEVLRGSGSGRRYTVRAGAVISNADLLLTLEKLVGPEHLEPGKLAGLRRLRPTYSCFLCHVGLEGIPDDVLERAQGYYWSSWDMDRVGIDALRCKIFSPTLYEPAMAPPGRQIVILQKVLEMDYERIEDWPAHKARTEAFLLEELERRIPGISERIVVKTSASAHTSWRFTLNHQGAMLGWEMSPDQLGAGRPDITSGIPNLFLVGHWTRPGGGITPVIISAQEVARKVAGALR